MPKKLCNRHETHEQKPLHITLSVATPRRRESERYRLRQGCHEPLALASRPCPFWRKPSHHGGVIRLYIWGKRRCPPPPKTSETLTIPPTPWPHSRAGPPARPTTRESAARATRATRATQATRAPLAPQKPARQRPHTSPPPAEEAPKSAASPSSRWAPCTPGTWAGCPPAPSRAQRQS